MAIFTGMGKPVRAQDFDGRQRLFEQMRRCSCGTVTFLPLPCRSCGKTDQQSVYDWARSTGKKWLTKRTLMSGLWTLAAMALIVVVSWGSPLVLAALIPLVVLLLLLRKKLFGKQKIHTAYWLFHRGKVASGLSLRKKFLLMEEAAAAEYINGYEGDLSRLENALRYAKEQQEAEQIYMNCRRLAQVYHNRRLSLLMARCLMRMTLYEGVCVDLDEVCRHLMPEDLQEEGVLLKVLSDCVRFTCIPPGDDTARALVRICGMRLQKAFYATASSTTSVRELLRTRNVHYFFSPEDRERMGRIWMCVGAAGCLDEAEAQAALEAMDADAALQEKIGMRLDDLKESENFFAHYWSRLCWYDANSNPRKCMEKLMALDSEPLAAALQEQWGAHRAAKEG